MAGGEAELQALREDVDSLRNALELAGLLPPLEDLDAGTGAADTDGEPETEAGDVQSPPPASERETAVHDAAAGRETRETE